MNNLLITLLILYSSIGLATNSSSVKQLTVDNEILKLTTEGIQPGIKGVYHFSLNAENVTSDFFAVKEIISHMIANQTGFLSSLYGYDNLNSVENAISNLVFVDEMHPDEENFFLNNINEQIIDYVADTIFDGIKWDTYKYYHIGHGSYWEASPGSAFFINRDILEVIVVDYSYIDL